MSGFSGYAMHHRRNRLVDSRLFRDLTHRDTQSASNALTVNGVCFYAIADVTDFDFFRRITHCPGGILKKSLLLLGIHHAKQIPRLRVIVIIVLPVIPVVSRTVYVQRRFSEIWLFLPLPIAIGFVPESTAMVVIHTHGAVAMEGVDRAAGTIDWDQVVVHLIPCWVLR